MPPIGGMARTETRHLQDAVLRGLDGAPLLSSVRSSASPLPTLVLPRLPPNLHDTGDKSDNKARRPRASVRGERATRRRSYRLSLCLAHQHLAQLPRDLREAMSANARTKVYFQASRDDAAILEREVRPELAAHDLAHLPLYTAAVRLCNEGQPGRAFTLRTEALPPGQPDRAGAVRETARRQNGVRREEFERQFAASQRRPAEAPTVQREVRAAIPSSTDAPTDSATDSMAA
jgi:hypothetical protein